MSFGFDGNPPDCTAEGCQRIAMYKVTNLRNAACPEHLEDVVSRFGTGVTVERLPDPWFHQASDFEDEPDEEDQP